MQGLLCRASRGTSKGLELDERLKGSGGIPAAFWKAGESCVFENLSRLPHNAAFLFSVSNSLGCSVCALGVRILFLPPLPPPAPETVLSISLTLRKCSTVGGLFNLALHCTVMCVKARKGGTNSRSLGMRAVPQETCSQMPKQAQEQQQRTNQNTLAALFYYYFKIVSSCFSITFN